MPKEELNEYAVATMEIIDIFNKKMVAAREKRDDNISSFIPEMMTGMSTFVGHIYGNLMMAAGMTQSQTLYGFETAIPILKSAVDDIIKAMYAAKDETRQ